MRKARIIIKDGIQEITEKDVIQLMDPANAQVIKKRIKEAIDGILKGTDYKRINPPTSCFVQRMTQF